MNVILHELTHPRTHLMDEALDYMKMEGVYMQTILEWVIKHNTQHTRANSKQYFVDTFKVCQHYSMIASQTGYHCITVTINNDKNIRFFIRSRILQLQMANNANIQAIIGNIIITTTTSKETEGRPVGHTIAGSSNDTTIVEACALA